MIYKCGRFFKLYFLSLQLHLHHFGQHRRRQASHRPTHCQLRKRDPEERWKGNLYQELQGINIALLAYKKPVRRQNKKKFDIKKSIVFYGVDFHATATCVHMASGPKLR